VAHDLNNVLTAILGYAELITEQIGPDKPIGRDLQEIVAAGQRAAALTRQLLAFSRKQGARPTVQSLNALVQHIEPMLRRLIPETITIRTLLDEDTHAVSADPTQLEQVLVNLVVNARDAMPGGGVITIAARNASGNGQDPDQPEPGAAEHVVLEVSDTGSGIAPDVRERIFEPFFTTKPHGLGTGLGLAVVQSIVKQLGGTIQVRSEPGDGTAFEVFLPRAAHDRQLDEARLAGRVVDPLHGLP
jgi:two-component system, cell cycle sensor histidine kinase and response regulator CckA